MKKLVILGLIGLVAGGFTSCNNDEDNDEPIIEPVEKIYEFENGTDGWIGDFADYNAGEDERYDLAFDYTTLPSPLDESEGALGLVGTNLSDDLFMFVKNKVSGLDPITTYNVTFEVQFASDAPDGLSGIGGSPGESVYVKAGAITEEPVPVENNEGFYRMNIDKGNQSQGGSDMLVLGDFSNDTDNEIYTLKTVSNDTPLMVTSDVNGELWLIVGTDSGFEGTTEIYYNTIKATFDEVMP